MLYRFVRAALALALHLFYRVSRGGRPLDLDGPVLFAGNHPNGLIDPALLFALSRRRITFLARAPLFSIPVLGTLLRSLGALPVYRKQDDPSRMAQNEGTLEAATQVLVQGGALTIFPEGKSHSEPALAELKTGASRIALAAAAKGARVRIVPVGLTYEDKRLFRSEVHVEANEALDVHALHPGATPEDREAVNALTARLEAELREVTLNLDRWEDLPLLETAERLWALKKGESAGDPERLRAFADGVRVLRRELPEQLAPMEERLRAYRQRLALVQAEPGEVPMSYRPGQVLRFTLRNLAALLVGLPLFALGMALFVIPYFAPRAFVSAFKVEADVESTVKFLVTVLLAPLWALFLAGLAAWLWGWPWGVVVLLGVLPLALFTRRFYERRGRALGDARLFFRMMGRRRFRAHLIAEGERLADDIERLAAEAQSRLGATPVVVRTAG